MRQLIDELEHDRRSLLAELRERDAEQAGEEEHREQLVRGERADHTARDDAEQEVHCVRQLRAAGLRLDRTRVECGRVDIETSPRLEDVGDHQAEDEREGGHDLEVEDRLETDPPDRLDVADLGDAGHHDTEDERRDHHLDELDESVPERFQIGAEAGPEMADGDAGDNSDEHLEEQRLVDRPAGRAPGGLVGLAGLRLLHHDGAFLHTVRGEGPGRVLAGGDRRVRRTRHDFRYAEIVFR